MALTNGVWGIDIGQCALKALRCELSDDDRTLVATAYDYIEYPKILSQPEAEPELLIREALEQFLARNKTRGDRLAMSVAGQAGLARFFKPPPVDAKKLPDIVKYEAKQQIPFPLEDVVWDWQQLSGGIEVEGMTLDAEVGLFAMKRDQVFKVLKPFVNAGIELDVVQLAPLSIYNMITHDVLNDAQEEIDPSDPPESLVVLSMGTDTTDLVVTNGHRLWQRNVPLGGNHFTKQLTKELKLTFAKAEHLKRNARQAEDPKTVFQAMRPVFNDLVTEIQRSIGFFQNIDRKAKIGKVLILGNTTRLPGLQQYLSKNLGYEVVEYPTFTRLAGSEVISSPSFKDNVLAFGVCYGLCLQGAGLGKLSTNLLPREILTQRLIREKKPWTAAGVGALLLACSFNFFFRYNTWYTVNPERPVDGITWTQSESGVGGVKTLSDTHMAKDKALLDTMALAKAIGEEVAGNSDRRLIWMEMITAVTAGFPPRTADADPLRIEDPNKVPFEKRQDLHIEYMESQYFADLKTWYTSNIQKRHAEDIAMVNKWIIDDGGQVPVLTAAASTPGTAASVPAAAAAAPASAPAAGGASAAAAAPGPEKEGWVIELKGYHYFNGEVATSGSNHVYRTLMRHLAYGTVSLPKDPANSDARLANEYVIFSMNELGIKFPTMLVNERVTEETVANPLVDESNGASAAGGGAVGGAPGLKGAGASSGGNAGAAAGVGDGTGAENGRPASGAGPASAASSDKDKLPSTYKVRRFDFTIQFVWQPVPLTTRLENQQKALESAAIAARNAPPAATNSAATPASPNAAAPDAAQPAGPNTNGAAAAANGGVADSTPSKPADPGASAPAADDFDPSDPDPSAPDAAAPDTGAPAAAAPGGEPDASGNAINPDDEDPENS